MKLWRKLLAAVTAGTICLGSIGAMLSISAETELDSSAVSENSTEVKASKGAHTHYYGELASSSDGCAGWYFYCVGNNGVKTGYPFNHVPVAALACICTHGCAKKQCENNTWNHSAVSHGADDICGYKA